MEGSFGSGEKRNHARVIIDLPVEYRDISDPCLHGAIVVNASEGGFLIESPRDISVGTELKITVLYPTGFELANFKVVAKVVRKEPYCKGNQCWEGYRYGLEFMKILEEDCWKLDLLLTGRYYLEEMATVNEVSTDRQIELGIKQHRR
ncbi:MAG TPA: PilZ domain-containing protein [Thermodesulfobacteriota bacterium]|nr:PilZ domain-containing protein [Thermodesulfobacteriota bacterium]